MKTYFPGDHYETQPEAVSPILRALAGTWRWFFYPQYFVEAVRSRHRAIHVDYDDAEWAESSYRVMRIIERNGGRFDIRGIDILRNAAEGAPYVFISNHMSTLETQIYPVLIVPFMPVTFVVKQELITHPFMGPVLRTRNPIPVARRNPRDDLQAVLEEGRNRLENGMSVVIFPQSTRTPEFKRESFNSLGIKLAQKAGVRIIPMAIKSDFWGERGMLRGFGPVRPERRIHIEVGEPMAVEGRGRHEHEVVVEFIESRLLHWEAEQLQDG
ncbi:MAG: lysophospholipid acyltransferase family protein [Spirochaetaceae bacterium]